MIALVIQLLRSSIKHITCRFFPFVVNSPGAEPFCRHIVRYLISQSTPITSHGSTHYFGTLLWIVVSGLFLFFAHAERRFFLIFFVTFGKVSLTVFFGFSILLHRRDPKILFNIFTFKKYQVYFVQTIVTLTFHTDRMRYNGIIEP